MSDNWQEKYVHPLLPLLRNTNTVPAVIFLRGISGSGKTSLSNALMKLLGSESVVSFSADSYFTIDGIYKFDISKVSEAHQNCVNSMNMAFQMPNIRYIIMDNTHTRLWHLSNAERVAQEHGAQIYYLDIVVPDKAHFLLCNKRQRHNVPEDVLLDQWSNWEVNPKSMCVPMFISEDEKSMLATCH